MLTTATSDFCLTSQAFLDLLDVGPGVQKCTFSFYYLCHSVQLLFVWEKC